MNEVTRIHLGRQSFVIAVDAQRALRQYLDAIKHRLGTKSGEVLKEVETRMAELLTERGISGDKVVLLEDIDRLKEQLGSPKDFSDDESDAEEEGAAPIKQRRLFRDTERGMIAGVCAGLATYLHIDVVLIRIIFALTVLAGGWGVFLYAVLWLVVPPVKTSSEFLQMHGKPVTVDSLKEVVARADVPGATKRASTYMKKFLHGLARIFLTIIGIGLVAAAIAVISVVIAGGIYMVQHHGTVFQEGFFPVTTNEMVLALLGLGMATIVTVFLILAGVSMVRRKWSVPGWGVASLIAVFFVSLAISAALLADVIPQVRDRYKAADHSVMREIAPFKNISIAGINYTEYIPSDTYKVEIRYIGDADPSRIKTTVKNDVLIVDASAFQDDNKCDKQCWLADGELRVIVHAPEQPIATDDAGVPVEQFPAVDHTQDPIY